MKLNRGFIGEISIFLVAILSVGGFLYTQYDPNWNSHLKSFFNKNKLEFVEQIPPVSPELLPDVDVGPDISVKSSGSVTLKSKAKSKDGSPLEYQWFKLSGGTATIVSPFKNTTEVKSLRKGKYLFRLIVTDEHGYKSADELFISVASSPNDRIVVKSSKTTKSSNKGNTTTNPNPDNIPPFASAGADKYLTLPQNFTTLAGSGSDSDGSVVSYYWTKISGSNATISNPNSPTINISSLLEGSYIFSLKVTDDKNATSSDTVSVVVGSTPPSGNNNPPKANAGPDKSVTLSSGEVTLSGSGSDSDGQIIAYTWTKISGDGGNISSPDQSSTIVTGLSQGTYTFELKVTDNQGASDTDMISVNVDDEAVNDPPQANAGPDQSTTLPDDSVTLSGSGSDSDGQIVAYTWTKISGSGGSITNASSAITTVTGLSQGSYIFRLVVEDDQGDNDSDTVVVVVHPAEAINEPPVALAGPDQNINLPTNSATLSGSGSDDGAIVSYSWSKISGSGGTITNPSESNTTITDLSLGNYVFRLTVTDNGGLTATDDISVTVQ